MRSNNLTNYYAMKKLFISAALPLLAVTVMLSTVNTSFAQAPPEAIQYQAVARDLTGAEISGGTINVRFTIYRMGIGIVYQETHVTTTNPFGLFTLKIGMGTPIASYVFSSINWGAGDHSLEVEVDYFGSGYVSMGITQLLSVPYALYAKNVLNGVPGPVGPAGIACWDLNGDGIGNPGEDINGDLFFNTLDCKGADGAPSTVPGPPGAANISGTTNNIVKFTAATTGGNSQIFDDGINVGIGTAAPTSKLDIAGTATLTGFRMPPAAFSGKVLTSDAAGNGTWQAPVVNVGIGTPNYLPKWNAAGIGLTPTSLLFDDGINVGVGTTTPSDKFHIRDGDLRLDNTISGNPIMLFFNGVTYKAFIQSYFNDFYIENAMPGGNLILGTNFTPQLTIDAIGNVGIGTSPTGAKLDVAGNVKITDGTQAVDKVLTSDATGMGSWQYALTPTKYGTINTVFPILNNAAQTYYTASTLLTITPAKSGTVNLVVQGTYNHDRGVSNQIEAGVHVTTSALIPIASTPLTQSVKVGNAAGITPVGFGNLPFSIVYSFPVTASTTYYIWLGASDLNYAGSGNLGEARAIATLHTTNGM